MIHAIVAFIFYCVVSIQITLGRRIERLTINSYQLLIIAWGQVFFPRDTQIIRVPFVTEN